MLVMNIIIVIVKISIRVRNRLTQIFLDFDPNLQHARSLAKSLYNRKVLFVTFLLIPSRLVFHGSRSVFMVFHGSRSVFMVFQGSKLVSHGYRWVLWLFKVPGWFFKVPGQFS